MNRTARRLGLAVVGVGFAALASFATASPAVADNGPHVAVDGNVAMAGGCASCHRIHSAQGSINQLRSAASTDLLCASCHGAGAPGSSTDVVNGQNPAAAGSKALRGGGFLNAMIGSSNVNYTAATGSKSIGFLSSPESSTSMHGVEDIAGSNGVGTLWGAAAVNGLSSSTTLECTSCHDPHGNGGYRILRPIGVATDNTSLASLVTNVYGTYETMTIDLTGSDSATDVGASTATSYKYLFTFHLTGATQKFTYGTTITVRNDTATQTTSTACVISGMVVATDTTTVKVGSLSNTSFTAASCTGTLYAMPAFPTTVTNETLTGTTARFYTAAKLGVLATQKVTIYSAKTNAAALNRVAVTASNNSAAPYWFEVTVPATFDTATATGMSKGYYVRNIPDGLSSTITDNVTGKLYTTTNFWNTDDHGDTTTATASVYGVTTPYVASIAAWCSSCHTRYLSATSAGRKQSGTNMDGTADTTFTFRHTSGEVTEGGKNCITCHVSHGSNASMGGVVSTGALAVKFPGSATLEDSALLRVDNRGVCLFCHASNVNAL